MQKIANDTIPVHFINIKHKILFVGNTHISQIHKNCACVSLHYSVTTPQTLFGILLPHPMSYFLPA